MCDYFILKKGTEVLFSKTKINQKTYKSKYDSKFFVLVMAS